MNTVADKYLKSGFYTDSDHPSILAFAQKHTQGIRSKKDQTIALYYAVRDGFRYNPYFITLKPFALKASYLLTKNYGYCVEKSNLYAAVTRALGIPSRLGYGNVRNHLATEDIESQLGTDVLVFHGYTEVYLEGKWVKATPVFNKELCDKFGVDPLDFDGETNSIFQASDKNGNPFMEYTHDYGLFSDLPFEQFKSALQQHYPKLFSGEIQSEKFTLKF